MTFAFSSFPLLVGWMDFENGVGGIKLRCCALHAKNGKETIIKNGTS